MEIICPKCNEDIAQGASGTISCVNDNCDVEVIGIIYPKPITFDLHAKILYKANTESFLLIREEGGVFNIIEPISENVFTEGIGNVLLHIKEDSDPLSPGPWKHTIEGIMD